MANKRLTWQLADRILKQNGFKRKDIRLKTINAETAEWNKGSFFLKERWWYLGDGDFNLPANIRYKTGRPGFILDKWEPDMIDEHSCRSLNPTKVPFSTEEKLLKIIEEYKNRREKK